MIQTPRHRYSRVVFPSSTIWEPGKFASATWSLLDESQRQLRTTADLARLVVQRGSIALENLPHLSIGKLITVERSEIEALRTLGQLLRDYQQHGSGKKPLSLGVFGPPGAGKSFAVKELASKLIREAGWLEFNLSQFDQPSDLIGAFHQVRDLVLQNVLPVAFFDEFDSQQFRWLQYLLAPMQDGRFQEGQLTHPLGKCIFVFAGGTSWTFETFGPPSARGDVDESEDYKKFRLLKGPDFKSRLDGYLNVIGPNRRYVSPPPEDATLESVAVVSGHRYAPDREDIYYPIRRALMIRGEFRVPSDCHLDIDSGLLSALLQVDSYRHGARSLGKILQPLARAPLGVVQRSLLPPAGQLAMHTDAARFIELVQQQPVAAREPLVVPDDQLESLASAVHQAYQELGLKQGWTSVPTNYAALSEFFKKSNRAAARRMLETVRLVGLAVDPTGLKTAPAANVRQHLEYHLELLAEAEHEGWMKWHLGQGWRWEPKRDDAARTHPSLVPTGSFPTRTRIKIATRFATTRSLSNLPA